MRGLGPRGVVRAKSRVRTTIGDDASSRPLELIARQLGAAAANRLWVADLTYAESHSGWIHAAFVGHAYPTSGRLAGVSVAADRPGLGWAGDGTLGTAAPAAGGAHPPE
jgi:hypothetical protein